MNKEKYKEKGFQPSATLDILNNFQLLGMYYAELEKTIEIALNLPITKGDFVAMYGGFAEVERFTENMTVVTALQKKMIAFGNASSLPEYLKNCTPGEDPGFVPDTPYDQIVWLAFKILYVGGLFDYDPEQFVRIEEIRQEEERLLALNEILLGQGGINEQSQIMASNTRELTRLLASTSREFIASGKSLYPFVLENSPLYSSASRELKEAQERVDQQNALIDSLNTSYILAPTWHKPTVMAQINTAKKRREELEEVRNKKRQLITDLDQWRGQMIEVIRQLNCVIPTVMLINNDWFEQEKSFEEIGRSTAPEKFVSETSYFMIIQIQVALWLWKDISEAVIIYTQSQ